MRVYLNKNKVNEEQDFIFYNHIFSRGKSKFTVEKLQEELKIYNLFLSLEVIQKKIDRFIEFGLLDQNFKEYKIHV
jgi:hypothetical protein